MIFEWPLASHNIVPLESIDSQQPVNATRLIDIFRFQILTAGQGLNDDMWHTLRFSRRSNSIKFQIDDEAAVRGT